MAALMRWFKGYLVPGVAPIWTNRQHTPAELSSIRSDCVSPIVLLMNTIILPFYALQSTSTERRS